MHFYFGVEFREEIYLTRLDRAPERHTSYSADDHYQQLFYSATWLMSTIFHRKIKNK